MLINYNNKTDLCVTVVILKPLTWNSAGDRPARLVLEYRFLMCHARIFKGVFFVPTYIYIVTVREQSLWKKIFSKTFSTIMGTYRRFPTTHRPQHFPMQHILSNHTIGSPLHDGKRSHRRVPHLAVSTVDLYRCEVFGFYMFIAAIYWKSCKILYNHI